MYQSFTIVPEGTRVFRTEITEIRASLDGLTANQSAPFIRGNFDSFRTFISPTSSNSGRLVEWGGYRMRFNYETAHDTLLAAKRFTLSFYVADRVSGKEEFFGEASVDLLTLAAGPCDVSLSIFSGDHVVGKTRFDCVFSEQAELYVDVTSLGLEIPQESDLSTTEVKISTRSAGHSVRTGKPDAVDNAQHKCSWVGKSVPPHYFGVGVADFLECAGFNFYIFRSSAVSSQPYGHAMLQFASQMKPRADGLLGDTIDFVIDVMDEAARIGTMTGSAKFGNMPRFVQMYGGRTIDGVVVEGLPYPGSHPLPPRVASLQQQLQPSATQLTTQ